MGKNDLYPSKRIGGPLLPITVTPYRLSLIGCGRVGLLLEEDPLRTKPASHLGGIQKLQQIGLPERGLQLTALCDSDPERLQYAAQKWQVPHTYTRYQNLINQEKPDLLIIASWTSSHHAITQYAARHGVKAIVLEKPLACSLSQAREMVETCQQLGVKLVVNHERRWDPLYQTTRAIIQNHELGPLRAVYGNVLSRSALRGNWQEVLAATGGGPLMHDGTHLIDMIRYLAGDITCLSGQVKREDKEVGTETSAHAMMQTENHIPVFIEAGGMRDYFNFELDLHFQSGRIRIGNGIRDYFKTQSSSRYSGFYDLVKQEFPPLINSGDPFTGAIMEALIALENNSNPQSSGTDALKAMEIIFAIYHSAASGGKPVYLPLPRHIGHPLKKMFRQGII